MHIRDVRHLKQMLELLFISTKTFSFLSSGLASNAYKWPNISHTLINEIPSPPKKSIYWKNIFFPPYASVYVAFNHVYMKWQYFSRNIFFFCFRLIRFPVATLFICLYTRFFPRPLIPPLARSTFDLLSYFLFFHFFDIHSWKTQIKLVNIEYIFTPTRALRIETTTERK